MTSTSPTPTYRPEARDRSDAGLLSTMDVAVISRN
jgi:hypothetical protein